MNRGVNPKVNNSNSNNNNKCFSLHMCLFSMVPCVLYIDLIHPMGMVSTADAIAVPTISLNPPLRSPIGTLAIPHAHCYFLTSSPQFLSFSIREIFLLLYSSLLCPHAS